jgi:hypothetical protein
MSDSAPTQDILLAAQRGLLFDVHTKAGPRLKWTPLTKGLPLPDALAEARRVSGTVYEVGLLVRGKIYWTTKMPDLFNSTVLQPGYT